MFCKKCDPTWSDSSSHEDPKQKNSPIPEELPGTILTLYDNLESSFGLSELFNDERVSAPVISEEYLNIYQPSDSALSMDRFLNNHGSGTSGFINHNSAVIEQNNPSTSSMGPATPINDEMANRARFDRAFKYYVLETSKVQKRKREFSEPGEMLLKEVNEFNIECNRMTKRFKAVVRTKCDEQFRMHTERGKFNK
ncbi:unnamed protein product [Rotaria socialis]|uniref:Uncharacterized protein n=1 Tax=Rotaria socialis TaxID=392032 RepID=A0A818QR41_9BILA|nr:unnamed protein product [Rotaria socialis]